MTATQLPETDIELKRWHLGAVYTETDTWAEQEYAGDEQGMLHPREPKPLPNDVKAALGYAVQIIGGGFSGMLMGDSLIRGAMDAITESTRRLRPVPLADTCTVVKQMSENERRFAERLLASPCDRVPKTRASVKKKQKRKSQASARRSNRK